MVSSSPTGEIVSTAFPLVATRKSEQSVSMIDPWTAVHGAAGLAGGLLGIGMPAALTVAVGYEIVENITQRSEQGRTIFNVSQPERPANQIMDILIFGVGVYLGHRYNESG